MHNLDTRSSFDAVDIAHMHERLASLPQQCMRAYRSAQSLRLPASYADINRVVLAGMGGAAISSSLVQALVAHTARLPVTAWHNYGLPAFARGAQTLVVVSSKSGNTEEVLSTYDEAIEHGCSVVALSTGGMLAQRANADGVPLFDFTFEHTPREAIGWLTFPLIALLAQTGVISDPSGDVEETVAVMTDTAQRIGIDSPAVRNPAKRMAGQVVDRLPLIYGAGILAPVAWRWKTVLNENAKLLAGWDEMPELNHNTVMGFERAEAVWQKTIVIQLRCAGDHPRVSQRFDLTTRLMLEAGINQDTVRARGQSALAQMFSLVQFGDWVSYYAAIMSGIDPTPTPLIDQIKAEL